MGGPSDWRLTFSQNTCRCGLAQLEIIKGIVKVMVDAPARGDIAGGIDNDRNDAADQATTTSPPDHLEQPLDTLFKPFQGNRFFDKVIIAQFVEQLGIVT